MATMRPKPPCGRTLSPARALLSGGGQWDGTLWRWLIGLNQIRSLIRFHRNGDTFSHGLFLLQTRLLERRTLSRGHGGKS